MVTFGLEREAVQPRTLEDLVSAASRITVEQEPWDPPWKENKVGG